MPQFRNITEETLYVVTDAGLVKAEPESVVTVSDDFAAAVYFQIGDTGETPLWELVAAPSGKKSASAPAPAPDPAPADPAAG